MSVDWRLESVQDWLAKGGGAVHAKEQSRIANVAGPARGQGLPSIRFTTMPGDNNVVGSGTWERAQLMIGTAASGGTKGHEFYLGFSIYVPSDFAFPSSSYNIVLGYHHSGPTGQAPIHLFVSSNGRWGWTTRGPNESNRHDGDFGPVERGKWTDFVCHFRWSDGPDGLTEVWKNDTKVYSRQQANMYPGQTNYLKIGQYHPPAGTTTTIYYSPVVRGSTYADAATAYGSGTPEPPPPPGPTVDELIAQAELALKATTITYAKWQTRVDSGYYANVENTKWWQALDLLERAKAPS